MKKVSIKATPNADTRTAINFSKEVLLQETTDHIVAVCNTLWALSEDLYAKGLHHDETKIGSFNQFYADFLSKKTGADFKALPWWKIHMTERHHLNDSCPEDVNLLDVIEMIVDGVCAGKARRGSVYPIEISSDILQKALRNTQKMIEENTEVTK